MVTVSVASCAFRPARPAPQLVWPLASLSYCPSPSTARATGAGENVERAKAGDKCIFTGALIVIPDVAQLAAPGERLEVVSKVDTRSAPHVSTLRQ